MNSIRIQTLFLLALILGQAQRLSAQASALFEDTGDSLDRIAADNLLATFNGTDPDEIDSITLGNATDNIATTLYGAVDFPLLTDDWAVLFFDASSVVSGNSSFRYESTSGTDRVFITGSTTSSLLSIEQSGGGNAISTIGRIAASHAGAAGVGTIKGTSTDGYGVWGVSSNLYGVFGQSTSDWGGRFTGTSNGGIWAEGGRVGASDVKPTGYDWFVEGGVTAETFLDIPSGAAPTVDAEGELAVDTTTTDFKPMLTFYDGSAQRWVIGIPTTGLVATDGNVLTYTAATDEVTLKAVTMAISALTGASPTGAIPYATSGGGLATEADGGYYDATNNSGSFGINPSTGISLSGATFYPRLRMRSNTTTTPSASIESAHATASVGPTLVFARAKGTVEAPTDVAADDYLSQIDFFGYDQSSHRQAAKISVIATENGASFVDGKIVLSTYDDGLIQDLLTLDHNGIAFSVASVSISQNLTVTGDISGNNLTANAALAVTGTSTFTGVASGATIQVTTTEWKDYSILSKLGFNSGWTLGTDGLSSSTDGQKVWVPIEYQPGTILTRFRIKYNGSNASTGVLVTFQTRDESGTTTTFTSGSQQSMLNNGTVVTTYDFADTTMSENNSYHFVIESEIPASQTTILYAWGIETSTRDL